LTLAFNVQYFPDWVGGSWSDEPELLQVPWCFNLVSGILHTILFLCEIWEVHVYRRMMREQRLAHQGDDDDDDDTKYVPSGPRFERAEPEDIELQSTTSPVQSLNEASDTPSHTEVPDNALVEMPGILRVELPDGRILELPEGCRVELQLSDNRRLRLITQPYELDSTSTASTQWYGSSPVAPSYKTQDW
jgi:hypothetical protein